MILAYIVIPAAILRAVTDQEKVDHLAAVATPRFASLLRLRETVHVYHPIPGNVDSQVVENGRTVAINRYKRVSQPYRDLRRFLTEERIMQYIVDPGILPIVTAISKEIMGRKLLVTRRVAEQPDDRGVAAQLEGFGVRVMLYTDEAAEDTVVVWDCLFGVA